LVEHKKTYDIFLKEKKTVKNGDGPDVK